MIAKSSIVAVFAVLLFGCASQHLQSRRAALEQHGYPPEYIDGHIDGCNSGTAAAGNPYYQFRKDVRRASLDKLYADGWADGFQVCKANYESTLNMMRR